MPEKFEVAKPFNTVNRRLKIGDPVTEADLVGEPLSFEHRIETGFITVVADAADELDGEETEARQG